MQKFQATTCECCSQTKDYAIALDRGSALIVLAVANAVRRLGRNRVHIVNEMQAQAEKGEALRVMVQEGYMSLRMIGNTPRPRYHGLIAFVDRGGGEYLLTRKGADFIRGAAVHKIAIIDKVHGKNAGYWEAGGLTTITELLLSKDPTWNWDLTETRAALDTHHELTEPLPL